MEMKHAIHNAEAGMEMVFLVLLIAALLIYSVSAIYTSRSYKKWPLHRYLFWYAGIICAGVAVTGPLAAEAHANFVAHMIGHLLLGMLAPFLLVFATPMALLLRTLNTPTARRVTKLLKNPCFRLLSNPVTAALLNVGGLFVLYGTDLYMQMHQSLFVFVFIHLHILLAGYLFTSSIIYIDVAPHRYSFIYRSVVLIMAMAAHKVLSKQIYAYPPAGVGKMEAEAGGLLMYYGGDAIDLALIVILCLQWYRATAPIAAIRKLQG